MSDVRQDRSNKGAHAAGWLSLLELSAESILGDPDLGELLIDNQMHQTVLETSSTPQVQDLLASLMSPIIEPDAQSSPARMFSSSSPVCQPHAFALDEHASTTSAQSRSDPVEHDMLPLMSMAMAEVFNHYQVLTWEDHVEMIHAMIRCCLQLLGQPVDSVRPSWMAGFDESVLSSLPISAAKRTQMIYCSNVPHVLGNLSSCQVKDRMDVSMRKVTKTPEGKIDLGAFWRTHMLEWSETTPHVIVCDSRAKALEIVESSALCTSMAKGYCDLTPSEWVEAEWKQELPGTLLTRAQEVCDAMARVHREICLSESLSGFLSQGEMGWEQQVRLDCGHRIISCKDDVMWRNLVERALHRVDRSTCDQVATMISGTMRPLSWPHMREDPLQDEWKRLAIDSWQIGDLVRIEKQVSEWSREETKVDNVWPFVVSRRTPVIVWQDGERAYLLVRCKTIWQAKQSSLHVPWPISLTNESMVQRMMYAGQSSICKMMHMIAMKKRHRAHRMMDMWDIASCMSECMIMWRGLFGESLDGCLASELGDYSIDVRRVLDPVVHYSVSSP